MEKTPVFFAKSVCFIYSIIMIFIFGMVLISDKLHYYNNNSFLVSNIFLFLGGLAFLSVIYLIVCRVNKVKTVIIICISFLAFIAQVLLIRSYYFITGWDVWNIYSSAVSVLTDGSFDVTYFSMYNNNLLLLLLFSIVGKLFGASHIYFLWITVQCAICQLAGVLVFLLAKKWLNDGTALFTYVLFLIFIGLSPWFSVPYSDATGLLFPITILYLYFSDDIGRKWYLLLRPVLIGILAYAAFRIKPQCFIVVIAVIITEFIKMIKNRFKGPEIKNWVALLWGFVFHFF